MSKKSIVVSGLIFCLVLVLLPVSVSAEFSSSPSGINRTKNTIQEKLGNLREKKETKKADLEVQVLSRIRKSVEARYNVFTRAVGRAEKLLTRIQTRIDKAQAAGKDVTQLNSLMTDAKGKLADAKIKLDEIKALKGTAVDKAGYLEVQAKFKAIKEDLHGIVQDASKMIRILKGFNSATSSGQNLQKEGTSPGKLAD